MVPAGLKMKIRLVLLFAALFAALPGFVHAHILVDGKGTADAFNYDEKTLAHLNIDCAEAYECREANVEGAYFRNCYYDLSSSQCQCGQGKFSQCNATASSLDDAEISRLSSGNKGFFSFFGAGYFKVKSFIPSFGGLPTLPKVVIGLVAVALIFLIFSRLRNTAFNNVRRARALHEKAVALHESGREDEAKALFEKSNYYREKG